jgi:phosphatidylethanolamine/phosphatidyl-N-methylethanolamine N-methyltransferase
MRTVRERRKSPIRIFLREFAGHPGVVGAIAPSSRTLAVRMLDTIDFSTVRTIVEYGPGTGVVTREITARVRPGTRFFAVERNESMADALRRSMPGVRLHEDSVENIEQICADEGVESVDAIVSGLPWSAFKSDLQDRILKATARVLRPGGQLMTFAYHTGLVLPAGRRFHQKLPNYFSKITYSRSVWLNVPPAFVVRCVR